MRALPRLLLLAVALLAVAAPGAALAQEPPPFPDGPAYSSPVTATSLQIARDFWKTDPCPGGVTFIVARLAATSSSQTPAGAAPIERVWPDHPCTIVLSRWLVWRVTPKNPDYNDDIVECGAIVHAVGHQLEFDHSDDYRSVMFGGELTITVRRCYSHFKPRSVSRKRDRVLHDRVWAQHPGSPTLDHMVTP